MKRGAWEVGAYALAATLADTEATWIERMRLTLGLTDWPAQSIGVVAVDVVTGKPTILRRESGTPIAAAVAASCARVAAQAEQLRNTGADVTVVFPDEVVLAAIGPRTMDVMRRPGVVRAALAQGIEQSRTRNL